MRKKVKVYYLWLPTQPQLMTENNKGTWRVFVISVCAVWACGKTSVILKKRSTQERERERGGMGECKRERDGMGECKRERERDGMGECKRERERDGMGECKRERAYSTWYPRIPYVCVQRMEFHYFTLTIAVATGWFVFFPAASSPVSGDTEPPVRHRLSSHFSLCQGVWWPQRFSHPPWDQEAQGINHPPWDQEA